MQIFVAQFNDIAISVPKTKLKKLDSQLHTFIIFKLFFIGCFFTAECPINNGNVCTVKKYFSIAKIAGKKLKDSQADLLEKGLEPKAQAPDTVSPQKMREMMEEEEIEHEC